MKSGPDSGSSRFSIGGWGASFAAWYGLFFYFLQGKGQSFGLPSLASMVFEWTALLVGLSTLSLLARTWIGRSLCFGFVSLFVFFFGLDVLGLNWVSYRLIDMLRITFLGGTVKETLEEVNISVLKGLLLASSVGGVFILGTIFSVVFGSVPISKRFLRVSAGIVFGSLLLFIAEQALSRGTLDYARRPYELPLYVRLIPPPNAEPLVIPRQEKTLKIPVENPRVGNPKSVVFLLLESLQGSVVQPDIAPALSGLARESNRFPKAFSEATATSLVWNTIFMDRPPYTFSEDRLTVDPNKGSPVLEFFKSAGYSVDLAISTNVRIKSYDQRILGSRGDRFRFFEGYDGSYAYGRDRADARTVDQALEWMASYDKKKPFFLLVQLEATHFPYEFNANSAVEHEYTEERDGVRMKTLSEIRLYLNRYRNAVNFVDRQVARLLEGLKEQGLADDTVIVAVSDHGEDFRVRKLFHLRLSERVRSGIPFYLKFPGIPARSDLKLATHRDLFPTLLDYLKVAPEDRPKTLGQSLLSPEFSRSASLTWNASLGFAEWTSPQGSLRLSTKVDEEKILLTPIATTNGDDDWRELVSEAEKAWDWRSELRAWFKY